MAKKNIHIVHRVLPYRMQSYEMLMRSAGESLKPWPDQGMRIALAADTMLRTGSAPQALNVMSKLSANPTASKQTLATLGGMFMDKMAKLSSDLPTTPLERMPHGGAYRASDLPELMIGTISAASKAGPLLRNPNTDMQTRNMLRTLKEEAIGRVRMAKPFAQFAGIYRNLV